MAFGCGIRPRKITAALRVPLRLLRERGYSPRANTNITGGPAPGHRAHFASPNEQAVAHMQPGDPEQNPCGACSVADNTGWVSVGSRAEPAGHAKAPTGASCSLVGAFTPGSARNPSWNFPCFRVRIGPR